MDPPARRARVLTWTGNPADRHRPSASRRGRTSRRRDRRAPDSRTCDPGGVTRCRRGIGHGSSPNGPQGTYADPVHRARLLTRLGLLVAALLPALAAVLGGAVQVTRCVVVPGGIAQVGVHLALLRPAEACPTTGVALGGDSEQMLAVVVMLTLPMLVLHAGVLAGGWGAASAVRRSLARLSRLVPLGAVTAPRPLAVPTSRGDVVGRVPGPVSRVPGTVPLLRGPPAALPA